MRVVLSFILSMVALGLSAVSAQASLITINDAFVAGGFNPAAPVDPVTGSFSVTFDNASTLIDITSGISITNLNIALGSAPAFTYNSLSDVLFIGGLQDFANGVQAGTDDFYLVITTASTNPTFAGLVYTQQQFALETFFADPDQGELTPAAPSNVPEPASLTLLGLGLASMGARRRRQRKA
jgi:hypothetical protein